MLPCYLVFASPFYIISYYWGCINLFLSHSNNTNRQGNKVTNAKNGEIKLKRAKKCYLVLVTQGNTR